jgi:hypothetical protein
VKRPHLLKAELLQSFRDYDTANTGLVTPEALVPILDSSGLRLRLSADDIRTALEKTPSSTGSGQPSQINYAQFIDALELHRSADSIGTPFFDARSTQITRLKHRAKELDALPLPLHQLSVETSESSSPLAVSPVKCLSISPSPEGGGDDTSNSVICSSPIKLFSPQKPSQPRPTVSPRISIGGGSKARVFTSRNSDPTPMPSPSHVPLRPSLPSDSASLNAATVSDDITSRSLPGPSDSYRTLHSESFSPVSFTAREFVRPGVVSDAHRESLERAVSPFSVIWTLPFCDRSDDREDSSAPNTTS